jgi:transcriptional regulator with XRE-family HTH domain
MESFARGMRARQMSVAVRARSRRGVGTGGRDEAQDAQLAYEQELLTGEAADLVEAVLASGQISRRELAQRLGVTEARVSQLLSGRNITLHSLAQLGWALGVRFSLMPTSMGTDRSATPACADPEPGWMSRMQDVIYRRVRGRTRRT